MTCIQCIPAAGIYPLLAVIVFQSWLMLFDICDELCKYWVKEGSGITS